MSPFGASIIAAFVKRLAERDCTAQQLADHLGVDVRTVREIIKAFHAERLLHLSTKLPDRTGKRSISQYRWGFGVDYKLPHTTSNDYKHRKKDKLNPLRRRYKVKKSVSI